MELFGRRRQIYAVFKEVARCQLKELIIFPVSSDVIEGLPDGLYFSKVPW